MVHLLFPPLRPLWNVLLPLSCLTPHTELRRSTTSPVAVVHNPNNKLTTLRLLQMGRDVAMGMNWYVDISICIFRLILGSMNTIGEQ